MRRWLERYLERIAVYVLFILAALVFAFLIGLGLRQ